MAELTESVMPPTGGGLHDPSSDDPFRVTLDADGLRNRSVGGSLTTAGAQVLKTLIQLGSQLVLARLLFPADFGLLAMVTPLVTFIQLFNNLGLGEVIVQRQTISHERVSSLFWLSLVISVGMALLVVLASPVAALIYGEPRVVPLMAALGAMIPIATASGVTGAILSRQMRFGVINANEIATCLVGVATTILCALMGLSFWSLILGQLASMTIECVLGWVRCGWLPSRPRIEPGVWADLKFGFNMTGFQLATFITSTGDNVIVGALNGKIALGFYDRSYRLVVLPIGQMMAPVSRVAVPLLSRLQAEPTRYRSIYLVMVRYILFTTVPAMLVCSASAADVVTVLLGPKWLAAAPTFGWIAVGGFASGLYSSVIWLYISQGKMDALMRYTALSSVFNIASFIVGAHFGITGVAASAALVFNLVSLPLVGYGATRTGPVRAGDLLRCCARFAAVGTLVWFVLHHGSAWGPASRFTRLVVETLVAYAAFTAAILVDQSERDQALKVGRTLWQNRRRSA